MKNRSLRKENIVQVYETPSANRLGYKTQSKYTKSKLRHRTGTILLRNASLCRNTEGKSGGRGMEYR